MYQVKCQQNDKNGWNQLIFFYFESILTVNFPNVSHAQRLRGLWSTKSEHAVNSTSADKIRFKSFATS